MYLTAHLPGCGGVFKASPEDFCVEELPAYLPQGDGEHLFMWVEKTGLSTPEAAKRLARALGVVERDVSWAGLKDRQAVTRQLLCVPARKVEGKLEGLDVPGLRVLWSKRHRNKLKSGHLKGNRFELVVRGLVDGAAAAAVLEHLKLHGLPNAFGDQRFGARGDNAARGKNILLRGGRHPDRFERKMLLSAYQSALFNAVLEQRLQQGTFLKVLEGDVLKKHETGGEFVSSQPDVDQPRLEAFEVSPTGPMFGPEMTAPAAAAAALEAKVLESEGLGLEVFEAGGDETRGTRRHLRVPINGLEYEVRDEALRLRFELPSGSYATVLLDELLKSAPP